MFRAYFVTALILPRKKVQPYSSYKELLDNIGSTIDIRVFLTGDLPADYKKLNIATQDMLAEFKDLSHNKINVRFENQVTDLATRPKAILYDSLASMGLCLSNRNSWQTITIKQRARLLFHLHWSHTKPQAICDRPSQQPQGFQKF